MQEPTVYILQKFFTSVERLLIFAVFDCISMSKTILFLTSVYIYIRRLDPVRYLEAPILSECTLVYHMYRSSDLYCVEWIFTVVELWLMAHHMRCTVPCVWVFCVDGNPFVL